MLTPLVPEIRAFILKNYLFTDDASALADESSLLQQGIMYSTGILELIMHLEQTYGITVADSEMIPDNLDTVQSIARFVAGKRAA